MKPAGFPGPPIHIPVVILLLLLLLLVPSPAHAHAGHTDPPQDNWKATYPAPVSNITQDPWTVQKGENVMVALTLASDAQAPERVSMIWCRVEPDYVCALPLLMKQQDPRTWTATIPGSYGGEEDVIQEETRHIGYNISLQYAASEKNTTGNRVWAPTHSTWSPDTFPEDSIGEYYFIRLRDAGTIPAPVLPMLLVLIASVLLVHPRSHKTKKTLDDEKRREP